MKESARQRKQILRQTESKKREELNEREGRI
jgi:hypothetical protein